MTLPEVLQSIPDDLLYPSASDGLYDRKSRVRKLERFCLNRGHRPTYIQLAGERARRKAAA